ncbi:MULTISPECIES: ABC transporter substrate-binding protein [unclassified Roseovarius]|uniref:substrate-binding periplasmic protein n=1 Tax=unclassified Roseovarius TaxID=2614913 RepID=UPI00273DD3F2|nr:MULTISPECIES: ABC transporter substrate-binding protein [unclassified Roseovarius]
MRVLSLAAAAVIALSTIARSDTTTLTLATGDYVPFTGENLPDGGVVNGIVQEVAARSGIDVEFEYMPWKRALEATRQGAYDGTSYWYYSEEREADFIHVGPLVEERQVFFAIAGPEVPTWSELEDLSGLRIGVVPGFTYTPELWELGESGVLTLSEATSNEANMRKLLAGRIDVFPHSEMAGWHLIRETFTEEEQARFVVLDNTLSSSDGYLLISRNMPNGEEVAKALQAAVDSLMAANAN